ncbi:hypothetical protein BH11PAT1_BH11PAT1_7860 [soil metagenome]
MNFTKYINLTYRYITDTIGITHPKFIYVGMGDSTAEGMGASHPDKSFSGIIFMAIKEYRKDSEYHNLGVQEYRIRDVLEKQLEKGISLQPDLVTLSIGANDLKRRTPMRQFEQDLTTVLSRLKKETNALIVINTIPDISASPLIPQNLKTITNLLVRRFNRIISAQAKQQGIELVDFYTQSRIFARTYPKEIFSTDRFHPSDFGYALWANTIITQIQDTIFKKRKFFNWEKRKI